MARPRDGREAPFKKASGSGQGRYNGPPETSLGLLQEGVCFAEVRDRSEGDSRRPFPHRASRAGPGAAGAGREERGQ